VQKSKHLSPVFNGIFLQVHFTISRCSSSLKFILQSLDPVEQSSLAAQESWLSFATHSTSRTRPPLLVLVTTLLTWSPGPRLSIPPPLQASSSVPLARRQQLSPHKPTGLPRYLLRPGVAGQHSPAAAYAAAAAAPVARPADPVAAGSSSDEENNTLANAAAACAAPSPITLSSVYCTI
jgi:hypothetical protein